MTSEEQQKSQSILCGESMDTSGGGGDDDEEKEEEEIYDPIMCDNIFEKFFGFKETPSNVYRFLYTSDRVNGNNNTGGGGDDGDSDGSNEYIMLHNLYNGQSYAVGDFFLSNTQYITHVLNDPEFNITPKIFSSTSTENDSTISSLDNSNHHHHHHHHHHHRQKISSTKYNHHQQGKFSLIVGNLNDKILGVWEKSDEAYDLAQLQAEPENNGATFQVAKGLTCYQPIFTALDYSEKSYAEKLSLLNCLVARIYRNYFIDHDAAKYYIIHQYNKKKQIMFLHPQYSDSTKHNTHTRQDNTPNTIESPTSEWIDAQQQPTSMIKRTNAGQLSPLLQSRLSPHQRGNIESNQESSSSSSLNNIYPKHTFGDVGQLHRRLGLLYNVSDYFRIMTNGTIKFNNNISWLDFVSGEFDFNDFTQRDYCVGIHFDSLVTHRSNADQMARVTFDPLPLKQHHQVVTHVLTPLIPMKSFEYSSKFKINDIHGCYHPSVEVLCKSILCAAYRNAILVAIANANRHKNQDKSGAHKLFLTLLSFESDPYTCPLEWILDQLLETLEYGLRHGIDITLVVRDGIKFHKHIDASYQTKAMLDSMVQRVKQSGGQYHDYVTHCF